MKAYILRIFIIVIAVSFFVTEFYVYAADNNPNGYTCNVTLTSDKTSVKQGENITYELKVSNINAGNGLKMIEFYTGDYDSNMFECKVRNYNEDKWSLINNEGYISITSNDSEPWKTNETIAKIIYTPKGGASNNTYQTNITNISATTDDNSKFSIENITLNIKVESEQIIEKNYSCTASFTPNKTSVKPGESITYDLKVSNINAGNGLKMFELYLDNYDTSKFECKVNNYNEEKWSIINTDGYILISLNNSEAWKTDEILAKITYTPKSGVTANTYQAQITNIKATTDDNSIISLKDTSLNIKVDNEQVIDKNYTCNMTFIPDKNIVKPGEDIAFELKVSNINAGNGLNKIELFLGNYDSNVFECKVSNYDENKWIITSSEGNIVIAPKNSQAWISDEILAKIVYTPKSGIIANTYKTQITNISATTADNTKLRMKDVTLSIIVANSNQVPSEDNSNATKRTTGGESLVSNVDKTSDSSNDDKSTDLPYTGTISIIVIIATIIAFASASTGFYIKYKKFNI